MKILIPLFSPPTGTWGSLTRVLAIAECAVKRGHRVEFCASGNLVKYLTENGYIVHEMPVSTMFGLPKIISKIIERRSQKIMLPVKPGKSLGSIWFVLLLSGMVKFKYLKKLVAMELDAIKKFKPEILFTEMDPGAFLITEITGIPLASTYASVMKDGTGKFSWNLLAKSMAKVLRNYGIRRSISADIFFDEKILKIIPSIPELEENIPVNKNFIYTGSLLKSFGKITDSDFKIENNRRYVFVYMGTGSISINKIIEILPKLFPAGNGPICLVAAWNFEGELKSGNVIIRRYFDAEKIIPLCEWVICHGGHNTIMQSLINAVPLIIYPGPIFERRFNARMVEKSKAGFFAEFPDFNVDWLSNAFVRQKETAKMAAKLSEKIKSYSAAETALLAIEKWLFDKKKNNA